MSAASARKQQFCFSGGRFLSRALRFSPVIPHSSSFGSLWRHVFEQRPSFVACGSCRGQCTGARSQLRDSTLASGGAAPRGAAGVDTDRRVGLEPLTPALLRCRSAWAGGEDACTHLCASLRIRERSMTPCFNSPRAHLFPLAGPRAWQMLVYVPNYTPLLDSVEVAVVQICISSLFAHALITIRSCRDVGMVTGSRTLSLGAHSRRCIRSPSSHGVDGPLVMSNQGRRRKFRWLVGRGSGAI